MKKVLSLGLVGGLLLTVAAVGFAATQPSKGKTARRLSPRALKALQAPKPDAIVVLDYYNTASANFYYWTGTPFYMSNLFVPAGGSYPLQVQSIEVFPLALDGATATGAAGNLDGVAVFDAAGNVIARELGVPATVGSWVNVALTTPPQVNTGNFYAGLWNGNASGPVFNDGGIQGSAINWTAPPTEPFRSLQGASAAAAGPFTIATPGDAYGTTSAAGVRATIDTNVPVELMRFDAE